VRGYKTSNYVR